MRRNELDYVLGTMLDSNKDVSDLNITVDKPLQVESSGDFEVTATVDDFSDSWLVRSVDDCAHLCAD